MAVYVDNMRARYRRMVMCHMLADTSAELLEMAQAIGVDSKWLQHPGSYREHLDICLSKKKLAVQRGAIEVDRRGLAEILRRRRAALADQQGGDEPGSLAGADDSA